MRTRDEITTEIRALQEELERLKVKRERIIVHSLKTAELEDLVNGLREQVRRRKLFLGGIYERRN